MRQRKVKNLDTKLANLTDWIIETPEDWKGHWADVFGQRPVYLEIGCGKGQFLAGHAQRHPENGYLGVEGQRSVILRAIEKAQGLDNVRFLPAYVQDLDALFAPGELVGIYLNFSDPWPKARHEKRRLTHHLRLAAYAKAIGKGGVIEIKTDNDDLFAFTLEQITLAGLELEAVTDDLHHSIYAEDNILTEYEEKFSGAGKNIHFARASVL